MSFIRCITGYAISFDALISGIIFEIFISNYLLQLIICIDFVSFNLAKCTYSNSLSVHSLHFFALLYCLTPAVHFRIEVIK